MMLIMVFGILLIKVVKEAMAKRVLMVGAEQVAEHHE
jgi:hypothetical protein